MIIESYDDVAKAQLLFNKMLGSCGPKCFRKLFTDAIAEHTLDEFYPVVCCAANSAALARAVKEKEQDNSFNALEYLSSAYGLKPQHLMNLSAQTIADIMQRPVGDVENMLTGLDFVMEDGVVVNHPETGKKTTVRFEPLPRRNKHYYPPAHFHHFSKAVNE